MTKQEKIEQYKKSLEDYERTLARANELLSALNTWDKKTINKTFFEHYFTRRNKAGEVSKDWKGNISTDFHFSDKQWEWEKYHKRIFLANSTYIEVQDATRDEVIRATNEQIENLNAWIASNKATTKKMEAIDEKKVIAEIKAIKEKYKADELWSEILDEVRY